MYGEIKWFVITNLSQSSGAHRIISVKSRTGGDREAIWLFSPQSALILGRWGKPGEVWGSFGRWTLTNGMQKQYPTTPMSYEWKVADVRIPHYWGLYTIRSCDRNYKIFCEVHVVQAQAISIASVALKSECVPVWMQTPVSNMLAVRMIECDWGQREREKDESITSAHTQDEAARCRLMGFDRTALYDANAVMQ